MARIVYCHPSQTKHEYHIYSDLDFWDVRRILRDLATVKRNFGQQPGGDEFPTQVVGDHLSRSTIKTIEGRLKKAIVSPPRHVVVRSIVFDGSFEFDPLKYYPSRWSPDQMIRFTYYRLPLEQGALCDPYHTVKVYWEEELIRVERLQREERYDPVIRSPEEARSHIRVPSCF